MIGMHGKDEEGMIILRFVIQVFLFQEIRAIK